MDTVITVRSCKFCLKELPLEFFHFANARKRTKKSKCRDCCSLRNKEAYLKQPGYYKLKAAKWAAENVERRKLIRSRYYFRHTKFARRRVARLESL